MIKRAFATALLVILLVGAACSSGSDMEPSSSSKSNKHASSTTSTAGSNASHGTVTTTTSTTLAVPTRIPDTFTGGDKKAYCSAWAELKAYYFYQPTEPDDIRAVYTKYGQISAKLVAAGPKEIKAELQRAQAINDEVVRTASTAPLRTPERKAITMLIQTYSDKRCA
jgi:hypothetical protein